MNKQQIPTLTTIIHAGDQTMRDHFDAHQLQQPAKGKPSVENASEFENISAADSTLSRSQNIPPLKAKPDEHIEISKAIAGEDFSEAMQDRLNDLEIKSQNKNLNKSVNTKTGKNTAVKNKATDATRPDELKQKIDQAITEALSEIEVSLRQSLYKKFKL